MARKKSGHREFGSLLAEFVKAELARAARLFGRKRDRLNTGIHQGRKSLRRSRAALALGGEVLGADAARLDQALRGVCRSLSRERDAQAVIDTLKLLAASDPGIERDDLKPALRLLAARRDRMLDARLARDPDLGSLRRRLAAISRRIEALPWADVEGAQIHLALGAATRRCNKAERRALRQPQDVEALHRWRRRLRRLRQQISALEKLTGLDWSEYAAVPDPADALSEAQDLSVLAATLRSLRGLDRDARRRLLTAIEREP